MKYAAINVSYPTTVVVIIRDAADRCAVFAERFSTCHNIGECESSITLNHGYVSVSEWV